MKSNVILKEDSFVSSISGINENSRISFASYNSDECQRFIKFAECFLPENNTSKSLTDFRKALIKQSGDIILTKQEVYDIQRHNQTIRLLIHLTFHRSVVARAIANKDMWQDRSPKSRMREDISWFRELLTPLLAHSEEQMRSKIKDLVLKNAERFAFYAAHEFSSLAVSKTIKLFRKICLSIDLEENIALLTKLHLGLVIEFNDDSERFLDGKKSQISDPKLQPFAIDFIRQLEMDVHEAFSETQWVDQALLTRILPIQPSEISGLEI